MDLKVSAHIELELLLQPISAERPAGDLLRYDGTYDRIQEARREDDQRLSQGIYQSSPKRADWETGEAICLEALEKRTKDLQIAGWLLEAWLHLRGFRGVEAGLRLLTGLCEAFWDDIYPELEGDNVEATTSPTGKALATSKIWHAETQRLYRKRSPTSTRPSRHFRTRLPRATR